MRRSTARSNAFELRRRQGSSQTRLRVRPAGDEDHVLLRRALCVAVLRAMG